MLKFKLELKIPEIPLEDKLSVIETDLNALKTLYKLIPDSERHKLKMVDGNGRVFYSPTIPQIRDSYKTTEKIGLYYEGKDIEEMNITLKKEN